MHAKSPSSFLNTCVGFYLAVCCICRVSALLKPHLTSKKIDKSQYKTICKKCVDKVYGASAAKHVASPAENIRPRRSSPSQLSRLLSQLTTRPFTLDED